MADAAGGAPRTSANKLFVGNLPADCTVEELRTAFAPHGTLVDVHLMGSSRSRSGNACAFIVYATPEHAQAAIQACHHRLKLREDAVEPLTVSVARQGGPKPATGGVGTTLASVASTPGATAAPGTLLGAYGLTSPAAGLQLGGAMPGSMLAGAAAPTAVATQIAYPQYVQYAQPAQPQLLVGTLVQPQYPGQQGAQVLTPAAYGQYGQYGGMPVVGAVPATAVHTAGTTAGVANASAAAGMASSAPPMGAQPQQQQLQQLQQQQQQYLQQQQQYLQQAPSPGDASAGGAVALAAAYPAVQTADSDAAAGAPVMTAPSVSIPGALPDAAPTGAPPEGAPPAPAPNPCELLVGNLPPDITGQTVEMVFSTYGQVLSVRMLPPQPGATSGCALVEYTSAQAAQTAAFTLHQRYEIRTGFGNLTVVPTAAAATSPQSAATNVRYAPY